MKNKKLHILSYYRWPGAMAVFLEYQEGTF